MTRRRVFAFGFVPFAVLSCGYHVAGTTDVLPKNIKTIAIPPFSILGVGTPVEPFEDEPAARREFCGHRAESAPAILDRRQV